MDEKYARYLLEKTKKDYQKIAQDFSVSRELPTKEMHLLVQLAKPRDKVLDIGCGLGKLFDLLKKKEVRYVGVDYSKALIELARKKFRNEKKTKFLQADVLDLPLAPNQFDIIFCIAVLHQIPSKQFRLKALKEIKRVLKADGRLIISVWNLFKKNYIEYIEKYNKLREEGKSEMDPNDILIPWKGCREKRYKEEKNLWYYHSFTQKELENLIREAGFKIIDIFYVKKGKRCSFWKGANLCAVVKKP